MSILHKAGPSSTSPALAVVLLLVSLAAGPQVLASSSLFQTIPTRTPAYTLPPGPTATAVTPGPTRTPGPPGPTATSPSGTATPLPGDTPPPPGATATQPAGTPGATAPTELPAQPAPAAVLACSAETGRADVLPGEDVEYALLISNTGTAPAASVILQDLMRPGIELVRVSATQGAVEVEAGLVTLRLGFIEPGQSALAILDLRASTAAQPGHVFLQQAVVYFDGGQAQCEVVAFGTWPDHLPATGATRRQP